MEHASLDELLAPGHLLFLNDLLEELSKHLLLLLLILISNDVNNDNVLLAELSAIRLDLLETNTESLITDFTFRLLEDLNFNRLRSFTILENNLASFRNEVDVLSSSLFTLIDHERLVLNLDHTVRALGTSQLDLGHSGGSNGKDITLGLREADLTGLIVINNGYFSRAVSASKNLTSLSVEKFDEEVFIRFPTLVINDRNFNRLLGILLVEIEHLVNRLVVLILDGCAISSLDSDGGLSAILAKDNDLKELSRLRDRVVEALEAKFRVLVLMLKVISSLMLELVDLALHELRSHVGRTNLLSVLDTRDKGVSLKQRLELVLVDLFDVFSAEMLMNRLLHLLTGVLSLRGHVKVRILGLLSKQMLVEVSNVILECDGRNVDLVNIVSLLGVHLVSEVCDSDEDREESKGNDGLPQLDLHVDESMAL